MADIAKWVGAAPVYGFILAILAMDIFGWWVIGDLINSSIWWGVFFFGGNAFLVAGGVYADFRWGPGMIREWLKRFHEPLAPAK